MPEENKNSRQEPSEWDRAEMQLRGQYKMELAKGLMWMNGAGAVALLAFLQAVWRLEDFEPLVFAVMHSAIILGIVLMSVGMGFAVSVHKLNEQISMRLWAIRAEVIEPGPGMSELQTRRDRRYGGASILFYAGMGAVVAGVAIASALLLCSKAYE